MFPLLCLVGEISIPSLLFPSLISLSGSQFHSGTRSVLPSYLGLLVNRGFYASVVNITPQVNGKEQLWNLAQRIHKSAMDAKGQKKHLSDLPDLAFLMKKVLENPSLTPSSALRSSFVWVLEDIDTVTTTTNDEFEEMGVEDYMACSSVHGIGPTLAITGKLRDGRLDCVCVYPAPLHSRHQIQQLVDHMKRILVDASPAFVPS